MPDLTFRATDVAAMPSAAVPAVIARLEVTNGDPQESIRSIALNWQARITPLGRSYSATEEARLLELFGERERWARTMTPLVWTSFSVNVAGFTAQTTVDLSLPCTLDFDVAATKYFYGLEAGSVDVSLVFSGTVFFTNAAGALQIAQIPWDREARFSLPVGVWQEAIAAHYGDAAWLRLPKACMDRLYRYRVARGISGWDRLLNQLLDQAERDELREASEVAR
ncbi:MAG TPA: DUF6084 family protein [Acidobacteriaceae bacterium]|jgi:hypothetical protein|nr:DUF6084 family protein [Acidobacteriaceae bacterium]